MFLAPVAVVGYMYWEKHQKGSADAQKNRIGSPQEPPVITASDVLKELSGIVQSVVVEAQTNMGMSPRGNGAADSPFEENLDDKDNGNSSTAADEDISIQVENSSTEPELETESDLGSTSTPRKSAEPCYGEDEAPSVVSSSDDGSHDNDLIVRPTDDSSLESETHDDNITKSSSPALPSAVSSPVNNLVETETNSDISDTAANSEDLDEGDAMDEDIVTGPQIMLSSCPSEDASTPSGTPTMSPAITPPGGVVKKSEGNGPLAVLRSFFADPLPQHKLEPRVEVAFEQTCNDQKYFYLNNGQRVAMPKISYK